MKNQDSQYGGETLYIQETLYFILVAFHVCEVITEVDRQEMNRACETIAEVDRQEMNRVSVRVSMV